MIIGDTGGPVTSTHSRWSRAWRKTCLNDLGQLTSLFPVLPTETLGELKEGGLRLGSNESEHFDLRVDVLKGSGVNRD